MSCSKCGNDEQRKIQTRFDIYVQPEPQKSDTKTEQQLPVALMICSNCGFVETYVSPAKR